MSAARVVASAVRRALPSDYNVYDGQITHDNPDEHAVAVYPMGSAREVWGIGSRVPLMVKDRVRIRLRALADDADWLHVMSHRLRLAALATPTEAVTVGRLYFGRDAFHEAVRQRWIVAHAMTDQAARFNAGRKYTTADVDVRLTMRPLPDRPLSAPWAMAGSPFVVFEAASAAAAVEVSRQAVSSGRVLIGGRLTAGEPGPATNPADEPFPAGARQGAFPAGGPGEVLWRNTSVGVETTRGVLNLFDATTNNAVPRSTSGGTVTLAGIQFVSDDNVSFVLRGNTRRFESALEQNGIFIGRIVGGPTFLFPLSGPPVSRAGDYHYDVSLSPAAGFKQGVVAGTTLWDWAFVDGREWETEPYQTTPPAAPSWRLSWRVLDGAGRELYEETFVGPAANGYLVQPVEVQPADGVVVQTVTLRDHSTPPIGVRSRYSLPVSVNGLVVHGEPALATGEAPEAPQTGGPWHPGFGPGFGR